MPAGSVTVATTLSAQIKPVIVSTIEYIILLLCVASFGQVILADRFVAISWQTELLAGNHLLLFILFY